MSTAIIIRFFIVTVVWVIGLFVEVYRVSTAKGGWWEGKDE